VVFAEDAARWLLVLHTAVSVATVGALTHLVVWMRGYRKGDTRQHRAVRKFAVISLVLFATNFVIGNVVYPTYKTRVRVEYLDQPGAVIDDARRRDEEHARAIEKNGLPVPVVSDGRLDRAAKARADDANRAARWFDVKEHWVSLGLALTAGLTLILLMWRPKDDADSAVIAPYTLLMAVGAAASVWIAAIIGVLTAAWRAI
jgi:hypothetical protein